MAEWVFIASAYLIFHAYFGYPLTLLIVRALRRRDTRQAPVLPKLTLIITASNEEKRIEDKIRNTLALDYPEEKLQVIVASDGSTDRTSSIVMGYGSSGIELLEIKKRQGKENAQREAVGASTGEVLVFTDVATMIEPGGLRQIVSSFADPTVGCVSSEDRVVGRDGAPSAEGFYVRYEMWLRRIEASSNSLVGLSGSFFAARREVCGDFSTDLPSDFRTLLNSMKLGLRGVIDPRAVGLYRDITEERREFARKVRTVLRGLTVFFRHLEFLNFLRYGLFSYQYLCHKLLRWMVPMFLISAFASNAALFGKSALLTSAFIGQAFFYLAAALGWASRTAARLVFIKIPFYFITVNTSILVAWLKYIRGERVVMWTPSKR